MRCYRFFVCAIALTFTPTLQSRPVDPIDPPTITPEAEVDKSEKVVPKYRLGIWAVPVQVGFRPKPQFGILITAVAPNSPAQKWRLEPKDVILQVDGKPITSSGSFLSALSNSTGTVTLDVLDWRSLGVVKIKDIVLTPIPIAP